MSHGAPITELIRRRYSCRTYLATPIGPDRRQPLEEYLRLIAEGPMGSPLRFVLVAAREKDRSALRGLGTYGFIRGATGFVLGAVGSAEHDMEDFGYAGEQIVLLATGLGLGSCWLGGTFRRSRFAERLGLGPEEHMPCVLSLGIPADRRSLIDRLSHIGAGSARRLQWERLFYDGSWERPLDEEAAGDYATPLEMVRLAPSASNRQPWRVVRDGSCFHFYLRRSLPRAPGLAGVPFLGLADLQRVDIGIAMCHFHLAASELGLTGAWTLQEPAFERPDARLEYIVTWMDQSGVRGTLCLLYTSPSPRDS